MEYELAAHLRTLEESHLLPVVRADRARLADLLHPSYTEIGASGRVFTRADVLDALPDEPPTVRVLSDFRARELTEQVALTTYAVSDPAGDRRSMRSSVWMRENGTWRLVFHQGTPG